MLRRRRAGSASGVPTEAFLSVLSLVEGAKDAVVGAIPSSRVPGRPLAEALFEFERSLHMAQAEMDGWRHQTLESEWEACREGIAEALRRSEHLRLSAPDLGFESLIARVAELIAPLEAFETPAVRLRGGARGR